MGCCGQSQQQNKGNAAQNQTIQESKQNVQASIKENNPQPQPEAKQPVVQAQQNTEVKPINVQEVKLQEKTQQGTIQEKNQEQNQQKPVIVQEQKSLQAQTQLQNTPKPEQAQSQPQNTPQPVISQAEKLSLNFQGNQQQIQQNIDSFIASISFGCPKQLEFQNFTDQANFNKFPRFQEQLLEALSKKSPRDQNLTIGQEIKYILIFDCNSGIFNNLVNDLLTACSNIEDLSIHSEGFTVEQSINDDQVKNLTQLRQLKKINLNGNIEGKFLNFCLDMQLKSLSINTKMKQEVIMPYLTQKGSEIEELILQDVKYCSEIIKKCPNITTLELVQVSKRYNEKDIQSILDHSKPFVTLKFMHLDQIGQQFWEKLLKKQHPELLILNLTGCREFSDQSVNLINQNCPKLQKLWLSKCSYITNEAIQTLLIGNKSITFLNIENIPSLNNTCLVFNSKKEPFQPQNQGESLEIWKKLTVLDISECSGITEQYIQGMKAWLPNIAIRQRKTFFNLKV